MLSNGTINNIVCMLYVLNPYLFMYVGTYISCHSLLHPGITNRGLNFKSRVQREFDPLFQ